MGNKPRTDTRAQTDKRTCLNGSKPPQVNAKCDVVMKLSVFGTGQTHTHARQNLYILALRAVINVTLHSTYERLENLYINVINN